MGSQWLLNGSFLQPHLNLSFFFIAAMLFLFSFLINYNLSIAVFIYVYVLKNSPCPYCPYCPFQIFPCRFIDLSLSQICSDTLGTVGTLSPFDLLKWLHKTIWHRTYVPCQTDKYCCALYARKVYLFKKPSKQRSSSIFGQ